VSSLIILDYETSGLSPDEHEPLELALIALEYGTLRELGFYTTVLKTLTSGWQGKLDDTSRAMHTNSGLLAEVLGPRANLRLEAGGWPTYAEAEAQAIGFMNFHGGQRSPLGGYNPEFDRGFMRRWMPRLAQNFHYRALDLNFPHILREIITGSAGTPADKKDVAHRALDDCRHAATALRRFLGGA